MQERRSGEPRSRSFVSWNKVTLASPELVEGRSENWRFRPAGLVSLCNLISSSFLDEYSIKYHYFHNTTYKYLFTYHALKRLIATNFWKIS